MCQVSPLLKKIIQKQIPKQIYYGIGEPKTGAIYYIAKTLDDAYYHAVNLTMEYKKYSGNLDILRYKNSYKTKYYHMLNMGSNMFKIIPVLKNKYSEHFYTIQKKLRYKQQSTFVVEKSPLSSSIGTFAYYQNSDLPYKKRRMNARV